MLMEELSGSTINSQILNCSNTSTILGLSGVGGICGTINPKDIEGNPIVSNCTNSGMIKSYGNLAEGNKSFVGGICGYIGRNIGATTKIEKCTNLGEVTGNFETINRDYAMEAGGIIGHTQDTEITKSKNAGKVYYDVASGNLITSTGLGGIVGYSYHSTIEQCFNIGEITSSYKTYCVAGILGNSYGSTIKNSYNTGRICGYTEVGGLVGRSNVYEGNNNFIYNSYNASESVLGSSAPGNLAGECTYITGNYTASITGKTDIGSKGTSCSITNKTYTLSQMKTLNSGLLTWLSNGEGKGMWAQETGVNDNLPYLVNNRP